MMTVLNSLNYHIMTSSYLIIAFKAVILGILEGLTEFIPVSSTAHLLLASQIINFSAVKNGVFEIVIQLGAILAVCVFYRKKIFDVIFTIHQKKSSRDFGINILLSFIPSVIAGVTLYKFIKTTFSTPQVIACALIIGGIIIILVERSNIKAKYHEIEKISKLQSFYIGLFQIFALIPGVSRSGATIIGSLILKVDRKVATEFSFFLAIPTIFGAVAYDLYKNYQSLDLANFEIIAIGFITAFVSSLITIKWFLNFVSNNNFLPFAYYRIILGILIWIIILI
jgi:undecaprenyl-diphosphatase